MQVDEAPVEAAYLMIVEISRAESVGLRIERGEKARDGRLRPRGGRVSAPEDESTAAEVVENGRDRPRRSLRSIEPEPARAQSVDHVEHDVRPAGSVFRAEDERSRPVHG